MAGLDGDDLRTESNPSPAMAGPPLLFPILTLMPTPLKRCPPWLVRALACLLAAAGTVSAATPLQPMVALFHKWQMAAGPAKVDQVAAQGFDRVQFCIVLQATLDSSKRVRTIGLYREAEPPATGNVLHPAGPAIREEFKGYLKACFTRALEHKLAISVLLHLNSQGEIDEWRNNIDFDPLVSDTGTSYEQSLLVPVMESLEAVLPRDWPVEVSLQGEMGTTVFKHPKSWHRLLEDMRARKHFRAAKFGLSFNYQGVAGNAVAGSVDTTALEKLWNACDFIGVSMYQGVSLPPRPADFDLAMGLFAGEFYGLKCPLPKAKPIHWVEIGIGGGGLSDRDWKVSVPAETPADAARAPYLGGSKPDEADPWADSALKALRRSYFAAVCDYLADERQRYPVKRAFIWNAGSWDPLGLDDPRFSDPEILRMIRVANAKAVKSREIER